MVLWQQGTAHHHRARVAYHGLSRLATVRACSICQDKINNPLFHTATQQTKELDGSLLPLRSGNVRFFGPVLPDTDPPSPAVDHRKTPVP
jgi:hypothetical protein